MTRTLAGEPPPPGGAAGESGSRADADAYRDGDANRSASPSPGRTNGAMERWEMGRRLVELHATRAASEVEDAAENAASLRERRPLGQTARLLRALT
jgi:hypothetical protein